MLEIAQIFHSVNITNYNDNADMYQLSVKFLQSLNLFYLFSIYLTLKFKIFIILIRNLYQKQELVNET